MKTLNYLFAVIIIISCNYVNRESAMSASIKVKNNSTLRTNKYHVNFEKIFGVYQLTDNNFAIVLPVQIGNEDLPLSKEYEAFLEKDSFPWIYGKPMKDYRYYDSTNSEQLIYNKRFEKTFKPKMKSNYFVYGTKGSQNARITRVVFSSNECGADYIAYLLKVDKEKTGQPLIASEELLPLEYKNNYGIIDSVIKSVAIKNATESVYWFEKAYQPKVFADIGRKKFHLPR